MAKGKRRGNPMPPKLAAQRAATSGHRAPSEAQRPASSFPLSSPREKPSATQSAPGDADPSEQPPSEATAPIADKAQTETADSARLTSLQPRPVDPAELTHLTVMGWRPPLGEYIASLGARRSFIWYDAKSRFLTQNTRMRLGSVWFLLQPLLNIAFFVLVFGVVLQVDRGIDNYIAWLTIGFLMFGYTRDSITAGTSVMSSGKALIRSFSFPRAVLPLSNWTGLTINMAPVAFVMLVLIMAIPPHELPQVVWPVAFGVFGLQAAFNLGLIFFVAPLVHAIPDLSRFVAFLMRFLMYGSGVIFPLDQYLARFPSVLAVLEHNPIYIFLQMYRQVLMDGTIPPLSMWIELSAWAVGLLLVGFLLFWRKDGAYGRED